MNNQLEAARLKVASIRFTADKENQSDFFSSISLDMIKERINLFELRISDRVTPQLQKTLNLVSKILDIPQLALECFVYASSDLQANCFLSTGDTCVLRFSSALIDLLDENEFAFVAGHEIGHYLLHHAKYVIEENKNLEYYMLQRYQEISADRVGLMACGSLDVAIKAMVKTISGLSNRHLRFDVSSFLSQLNSSQGGSMVTSTHPSMIIRCRALLWFSLSDTYLNGTGKTALEYIDEKILHDFQKHVDGPVSKMIEKTKETLSIWLVASNIIDEGIFSKEKQEIFAKRFGLSTLKSMKNFFSSTPLHLLKDEVEKRIMVAKSSLQELIPVSYEEEWNALTLQSSYENLH